MGPDNGQADCHRFCAALHVGKPHDPYYLGMANTVLATLLDLPVAERMEAVGVRARPKSADLEPGTKIRWKGEPQRGRATVAVLDRRKEIHLPGWWVVGGGGIADFVLDDPDGGWEVVPDGE